MGWTEEKIDKLKELWGKGNTASQIAEIIGGINLNLYCLIKILSQLKT